jgi:peptidyl-prolyl cis-trans isomerase B (cyclophilin B)
VPNNKQRREAARRRLERQLQRRQELDVKRKQRTLIATIAASIVVVLVIVLAVVFLVHDDKKTPTAAASTPAASDSVTPTNSGTPEPTQEAGLTTTGPCKYTSTSQIASRDVGVPPDPAKTPTENRVATFTSNKGPITMTLDASIAPCTVQSIAYLIGKKYYDNTSCHRLVTTGIFVLQCGDPTGTGSGGPGYSSKDENLDQADYSVVGTVAMANSGAGSNTDGSQFFIIYKDTSQAADGSSGLPKNYTEIGHITAGMDIVQAVAAAGEIDSNPAQPGDGKPKDPLTFTTVTVKPAVVGSATMVTPAPTATPTASVAATPTVSTS